MLYKLFCLNKNQKKLFVNLKINDQKTITLSCDFSFSFL